MPPKIRKKRKPQKSSGLEVNAEAIRILRTVKDEEAFYFYEAIGKPTGESARSLSDFLEKIKSVKLESLLFHLQRKDFQTWINKILGDSKLARKIGRILPSYDEKLRTKIQAAVESRIRELGETPLTLLVSEDLAVVSPISMS
jgi:predicted adenine nucleotide alpha hydrolase (AANH) superfamily ATPase